MKYLAIVSFLALASCATDYQPQNFTGGYSEFKIAPDTATVTFNGNGFTNGERAVQMAILRCADLTLQSGYRYFTPQSASAGFTNSSFSTPGFATTNIYGYGNYATANTFITPLQTYNIQKPGVTITIKMSNSEKALMPSGHRVLDAQYVSVSLRGSLGIKSQN
jgi:hypothetical protein